MVVLTTRNANTFQVGFRGLTNLVRDRGHVLSFLRVASKVGEQRAVFRRVGESLEQYYKDTPDIKCAVIVRHDQSVREPCVLTVNGSLPPRKMPFHEMMRYYRDYNVLIVIGKNIFSAGTSILCVGGKYADKTNGLRMLSHGVLAISNREKAPSLLQGVGRYCGVGHEHPPEVYTYKRPYDMLRKHLDTVEGEKQGALLKEMRPGLNYATEYAPDLTATPGFMPASQWGVGSPYGAPARGRPVDHGYVLCTRVT